MNLIILCIKIFFARIIDVSLGTIRTVFVVKEQRIIATLIAFFEVLIWFEVARESLNTEINSYLIPVSYSAGYATGTYIGTYISSRFIRGHLTVNVFFNKLSYKDLKYFKKKGYGLSIIKTTDNKKMVIFEIEKKSLKDLKTLILSFDKKAFIVINDTKFVENGFIK